ncbi:MAG: metallophosphoesterase family protein, partial [Streptococcaceae bacterium]|nr:metallophosphoesterase family protein [Streptococcaceae bacterium]
MFIVMSDSHGDREIVEEIKARYLRSATAIFHCGDSELSAQDKIWQGITVVSGNCDYDADYQNTIVQEVENHRVLVT